MDALTDEELSMEMKRRSDLLEKKRQTEETSAIAQKRMRLQRELDELDYQRDSWSSITLSTSSSAASSSSLTSSSSAGRVLRNFRPLDLGPKSGIMVPVRCQLLPKRPFSAFAKRAEKREDLDKTLL